MTTEKAYGKFPPTCIEDIMSYDTDEVVAGYREGRPDDPMPGENRDPGYRWGWANRLRDTTGEPDQFSPLRHAYYRALRSAA
jgi:hypothetical protein